MADEPSTSDFEAALGELEKIVERMERGEQTLEASLKDFERGVALSQACEKSLREAEQRIDRLVERNGTTSTEPMTPHETNPTSEP